MHAHMCLELGDDALDDAGSDPPDHSCCPRRTQNSMWMFQALECVLIVCTIEQRLKYKEKFCSF